MASALTCHVLHRFLQLQEILISRCTLTHISLQVSDHNHLKKSNGGVTTSAICIGRWANLLPVVPRILQGHLGDFPQTQLMQFKTHHTNQTTCMVAKKPSAFNVINSKLMVVDGTTAKWMAFAQSPFHPPLSWPEFHGIQFENIWKPIRTMHSNTTSESNLLRPRPTSKEHNLHFFWMSRTWA